MPRITTFVRARFESVDAYVRRVNARSARREGIDCRGDALNKFDDKVVLQLNTWYPVREVWT